jgi:predicted ATPase
MLTKIEIDGFKSFANFALDVPPFLAVIGANSAGKSNLFDAMQFLRRVTDASLTTAVQDARGDLDDLFRHRGDGTTADSMNLAVELLLEPTVRDPWGTEVRLTQTRVRYELTVARREDSEGNPRLYVEHEKAIPLRRGESKLGDRWRASREFVNDHLVDGGRKSTYLDTLVEGDRRIFRIGQDGVQGRPRPAEAAEATVLSSMSSAEFKHLYAIREEIRSWRLLQLEPHALRQPADRFGEDRLQPDGGNLARVLGRIRAETTTPEQPDGVLADISADLAALIPGVLGIAAVENPQTRRWEIQVRVRGEGQFRADVASDGTLRILALLAALYDPRYRGLLCFEEPENGVHPARLRALLAYVKALVTDPSGTSSPAPLSQVILNSHSPLLLHALDPQDCIVLEQGSFIERAKSPGGVSRTQSRVSQFRRVVQDAGQASMLDFGPLAPTTVGQIEKSWVLELLEHSA